MRRDHEATPQQTAMSLDSSDGPQPGGSRAPVLDAPLPVFPVLPQPPGAAAMTRPAPAQPGGTLDAQWMEQTWRSAKGMERRWQRLRAARSEAVHAALDHATAATAEAEGHVAELRAKGPEKAGAPAMIPSAMSAGDAAMCSESGSAGTLSASGPHQVVPTARRRRRGGGVEHRPVRGSHGVDAEGGQGDGAGLQWQCQVTRPGRVMPHPVSLTLSDTGLLLQWNHIEALIGKDSLAEASFLTGKDYIAAVNLLAVTTEGGGAEEGVGVEASSSGDDGLDAHGNECNALCLHVLTTPSPVHSPEGQSDYLHYRFFNFEPGGGLNDGASQWASAGCAMRACRDALKVLASAWPSLSGRRAPLAGADGRLTSNPPADDAGPLRELKAATGAETAENLGGELPWRVYFIVNPVSGHRMGEAIWHKIEPLFRVAGVPLDYLLTSHAGHASAVVAGLDLSLYHVLICIGGDGTVSEVVNAIMRRGDADRQLARLALATLPAGSECALAKMVGFVQPLAAAWCILKGHRERAVDLLRITQPGATTYSICGVGWGIAGKLAEDSEALRSLYGPARYLVSGLKSFVSLKGCEGALEIQAVPDPSAQHECLFASHCPVCQVTSGDGLRCGAVRAPPRASGAAHHVTWKGPFVCVAILKTEKALVPHVHCNDGYVDVIAVPDVGRIELLRRSSKILMPDLMGHHLLQPETAGLASMDALSKGDSDFLYTKARSVVIKPRDRDDKFNVDGEVLDGEEMHVEVLPGKLRMLFAFHESAATHHAHKAASAGAGSIQGLVGGGIQGLVAAGLAQHWLNLDASALTSGSSAAAAARGTRTDTRSPSATDTFVA